MTILITRPHPSAQQLVLQLQQYGIHSYAYPLIEIVESPHIQQLDALLSQLAPQDSLCAVSSHAVMFADKQLRQQRYPWPNYLSYYAIGQRSAQQLQQASQQPVDYCHDIENSEGLLTLAGLTQITGRRILILRGQTGREMLAKTLQQRGADVFYCECYQRRPVDYPAYKTIKQWQQQKIQFIVITSAEILHQLYTLCAQANAIDWLLQCQLVTVSQRLTYIAKQQGWQYITTADNANNETLLAVLLDLIH